LITLCARRGLKVATAESCTGGLVAATLTEIPGSSAVVERGFVTYSNESKVELLGVDPTLIAQHGAVSDEVALAMAQGALARSRADIAVSITGIAGPGGATPTKPVGLVYFGLVRNGHPATSCVRAFGERGRFQVRLAAVEVALGLLEAAAR
jgi:nicotinamide-nucleotide amidase